MKKFVFVILGLVLAVLLTVILGSPRPAPEVTYEGKPISTWAVELNNIATRDKAIEVFHRLNPDAALALAHMLRTPDPMSGRIVKALGRRASRKTELRLYHMVNPFEAPARRAAAAQALRAMGPKAAPAIPAMRLALRDDQTVCWNAALSLAECGPAGTTALIDGLNDQAVQHRGFVCYALGTQGPAASNAVPALLAVLKRAISDESEKAAEALGNIGRLAAPALMQNIGDTNVAVRLLIIGSLARMGPPARDCMPRLAQIAKEDEPAARLAAIEALARMQPSGEIVVAAQMQALRDPSPEIRAAALRNLSRAPRAFKKALPDILILLKDPSSEVRNQTVQLLGEMGPAAEQAIPELTRSLQDESETVRMSAREALEKLQSTTAGTKSKQSDPATELPKPPR